MRQYILTITEDALARLEEKLGPDIKFLEVQGMGLSQDNKDHVLLTPVLPPVPPAVFEPLPVSQQAPCPEQPAAEPVA